MTNPTIAKIVTKIINLTEKKVSFFQRSCGGDRTQLNLGGQHFLYKLGYNQEINSSRDGE